MNTTLNRRVVKQSSRHLRSGMTLFDVLAATAVLVVLGVVATVALAQPWEVNTFERRTATLKLLGQSMAVYAANNADFYAGPNTSGAIVQATNGAGITGNRTGITPTSSHDWISPTLGLSVQLPVNRAERYQTIVNRYKSWRTTASSLVFGGSSSPDIADFAARQQQGGFKATSYLSPSAFHYFPNTQVAQQNRYLNTTLKSSFTTPVAVDPAFRPRLFQVGAVASGKVYAADGARFVGNGGIIDMDASTNPGVNGNFLDPGPILQTSTAYGRNSSSGGLNVPISFRQPDGSLDAVMFDGSARNFTRQQAWTDATPWYPGGSVFNGIGATPESQAFHGVNTVLP